jgi:hypothetical protein
MPVAHSSDLEYNPSGFVIQQDQNSNMAVDGLSTCIHCEHVNGVDSMSCNLLSWKQGG